MVVCNDYLLFLNSRSYFLEIEAKLTLATEFNDKLLDSSSTEFKELAATLKKDLLEMLLSNKELSSQSDLDVVIVGFG